MIENENTRTDFVGNGGSSTFATTFRITNESHVKVIKTNTSTGVSTTLTLDTDYTVANVGQSTASITLVAGALASGYTLTLLVNPPFKQQSNFTTQRTRSASTDEGTHDFCRNVDKRLKLGVDAAIKLPENEDPADFTLELPQSADRANGVLYFDSDGNVAVDSGASLGVGGFTDTRIPFANGAGLLTDSPSLTWDSVNSALSVDNARLFTMGAAATGRNLFLGETAGNFTTTGTENTGIGYLALNAITGGVDPAGRYNTAVGSFSQQLVTSGYKNTSIGRASLDACTTGNQNTALGYGTMHLCTTGSQSVAVGMEAVHNNVSSNNLVGVGFQALYSCTAADNVAIGAGAMYATVGGNQCVAIGTSALSTNVSGVNCVAIGFQACLVSTGNTLLGIGTQALYSNTTGIQNTAVGTSALQNLVSNNNCTAIGHSAMYLMTGDSNTAIGSLAGVTLVGGSNCTLIGKGADVSSASLNYAAAIGWNAIATASNTMQLGGTVASGGSVSVIMNGTTFTIGNDSAVIALGASSDCNLIRSAADTFSFVRGTNAQTIRIYGDATHYGLIQTSGQNMYIDGPALNNILIGGNTTSVIPNSNATVNLGASGNRWLDGHFGGTMNLSKSGVAMVFTNATTTTGANTGTLTNCPHNGNPALYLEISVNGTTYCVPCFALT